VTDVPTSERGHSAARTTAERAPSEARTTAELARPAPLTLAAVPGLQVIAGDAVGFCGPDGCSPVAGTAD
jgi:hypothetical protein